MFALRLAARATAGIDPSDADQTVLFQQQRDHEPIGAGEQDWVLSVGNNAEIDDKRSAMLACAVKQVFADDAKDASADSS